AEKGYWNPCTTELRANYRIGQIIVVRNGREEWLYRQSGGPTEEHFTYKDMPQSRRPHRETFAPDFKEYASCREFRDSFTKYLKRHSQIVGHGLHGHARIATHGKGCEERHHILTDEPVKHARDLLSQDIALGQGIHVASQTQI